MKDTKIKKILSRFRWNKQERKLGLILAGAFVIVAVFLFWPAGSQSDAKYKWVKTSSLVESYRAEQAQHREAILMLEGAIRALENIKLDSVRVVR